MSDSESQNSDYEGYEEHKQKAEMLWWSGKYVEANNEFKAIIPQLGSEQCEQRQYICQFAMEMNVNQVEHAGQEGDNEKKLTHFIWLGYWLNAFYIAKLEDE